MPMTEPEPVSSTTPQTPGDAPAVATPAAPLHRRVLRRLFVLFLTRERERHPHWGVTLIGIVTIVASLYTIVSASRQDYSQQIICHAAMIGEADAVAQMLYHNGNLTSASVRGLTVLHWAVAGGSLDTVKVVVTHGADVNAQDSEGVTPLHIAAIQGFTYISTYLLAHHAKVNAEDKRGATPLDWALTRNQHDVVELLRTHGGLHKKPAPAAPQPPTKAPEAVDATQTTTARDLSLPCS